MIVCFKNDFNNPSLFYYTIRKKMFVRNFISQAMREVEIHACSSPGLFSLLNVVA